jgi:hypothetical protein
LFRSPNCIRGWLAYISDEYGDRATFKVVVKAENGAKAKNRAITSANKGFKDVEVIGKNFTDKIWGINNFQDLKEFITAIN